MATRATVFIFDVQYHRKIVQIYHHYDGYPEGLGEELKQYLENINTETQGLGELHKDFNGCGCFTASLIAHLKECPGNVYVEPTDVEHGDIEYEYTIYYNSPNDIKLVVEKIPYVYEAVTLFERSEKD